MQIPVVTVTAFESYWATTVPDQWNHNSYKLCICTASEGETGKQKGRGKEMQINNFGLLPVYQWKGRESLTMEQVESKSLHTLLCTLSLFLSGSNKLIPR